MKTDVVCAIFVINFSMLKNFLFSTDIGKRFIRLDKTKRCAGRQQPGDDADKRKGNRQDDNQRRPQGVEQRHDYC